MHQLQKRRYDVVVVIPNFLHMPTGGDREVSYLCKRLIRDNYSVAIVYLRDPVKRLTNFVNDPALTDYLQKRPLSHRLYYSIMGSSFGYRIVSPFIRKIKKIDFKEQYNGAKVMFLKDLSEIETRVILAQSWEAAFFVQAAIKAKSKFYRIHHDLDDPSFSGPLHTIAAKSYDLPLRKIVMNSHMEMRFERDNPIRNDLGIELDEFPCRVPIEKRGDVVLFPLRRNESKGAHFAIEAAHIILEEMPGAKIVAFGNVPMEKVPESIDYHGVVSQSDLIELYNTAAVTVIPSIVEGTSLPALEAMSCGSALITTDNHGVTSMVENGKDALVVPVKDARAIADAVLNLLKNPEMRKSIAHNGQETSKHYSYDNTYSELIKLVGLKE